MAQVTIGSGFQYHSDLVAALRLAHEKLARGEQFTAADLDIVTALFNDRERELEGFLSGPFPVFDQVLTEDFTNSVSFVSLGGPTVTVRTPRGAAIVHGGGTLQATVAASTLQIALFIDGVQFQNTMAVLNIPNNSGSQGDPIWITGGSTYLVSGLEAGDHTFELRYRSVTGTGANFSNRFLQVTPLKGSATQ